MSVAVRLAAVGLLAWVVLWVLLVVLWEAVLLVLLAFVILWEAVLCEAAPWVSRLAGVSALGVLLGFA